METGAEFLLDGARQRWTLGSSRACEIMLDDPTVSRAHCIVERRADHVVTLRDLGSKNGTLLDNNPVTAALLCVGAVVQVGTNRLVALGGTTSNERVPALEQIVGHAPSLRAVVDQAIRVAQSDAEVLVVGETGTGKELIARLVHENSRRASAPFVTVNCGAIPRELIASEMFGHERGAFTGASEARDGYFAQAHGGTLFLDEIGEMPLEMQPHLLRALETRTIRRVGGSTDRPVNVRLVCATNRIDALGTAASTLRQDIYHRIATVVLQLPPLRHRMGDLTALVESRLAHLAPEFGERTVAADAWKLLSEYRWPGNVRELVHAVDRAVCIGGAELVASDFAAGTLAMAHSADGMPRDLEPYEQILRGAMEHALIVGGSIRRAAASLGMPKSTFAEKARAWNLATSRKRRG